MKQLSLATIPVLCAAVAPLCADAQGTNQMTKQQMYMQEMNQITPSAEPSVTRYADPYLTADFIWWRAQEDGLEYAFNGVSQNQNVIFQSAQNADAGNMQKPGFEYEPGFKVGAGLKFRHDGWDFFAQYTWLQSDGDSSVSQDADLDSSVMPNIATVGGLNSNGAATLPTYWVTHAHADWNLHFNVLDLELGRNFWISKWLTLRPFVGMKFDWMDQDYNVRYDGIYDLLGPSSEINGVNLHMDMDQDQWAVGLRAGLNTSWYMWKKWAIFGDIAVSGMLNDFDVSRKDRYQLNTGVSYTQNNWKRDSHPVTAVLEWALGLRFECPFHNDDFMFQLEAGWEEQIWFNQNQFIFIQNAAPADLSFQGLTVKAAFYF